MGEEEEVKFCPFLSAAMLIARSKEGRHGEWVVCHYQCALFVCDGITKSGEEVGHCSFFDDAL